MRSVPAPNLASHEWARIEPILADFEAAWQAGRRPRIDDYLPEDAAARQAALIELVHAELEFRLKAGEPARVEEYFGRFPSLTTEPDVALDLVEAEYRLRRQRETGLTPAELVRRFPEHELRLRARFGIDTEPAATTSLPEGGADAARPDLTEVGPYEVLGVLGRGGMGVVYQARDRRLGRLVALKMILAGPHASAEVRARFRTEAEAVARLRHPNIVQIYEVGEHDGRPYLALEYVDGGSLDRRLKTAPLEPPDAARLVETLARAVHHAHTQGVIHRDLKPGNVLLAVPSSEFQVPRDEGATPVSLRTQNLELTTPTPKVTDFGLAKQLAPAGGGESLTSTGAVLGTPSYMAPEQAAGLTHHIGPAADIYALGAILYGCLTGRPPFLAASPVNALVRVLHEEPLPPSQLEPRLSRDLDTICLKCLEKLPERRYASALALAEDLRRFLDGRPIEARPTPRWERALKWARRRPASAALVVVLVLAAAGLIAGALWHDAQLRREQDRVTQEADQARRNLQHARQAADVLVAELAEGIRPLAGTQAASVERILSRAAGVYEDLLRESDDPSVREGKARMLLAFADVYLDLNRSRRALESAREAQLIFTQLKDDFPEERRYRASAARSQEKVGQVLHEQGHTALALPELLAAREQLEELTALEPDNREWQAALASTCDRLANIHWERSDLDGLRQATERALAIHRRLLEAEPDSPRWQRAVAVNVEKVGDRQYEASELDAADASYRQALRAYEELARHEPSSTGPARDRARVLQSLGMNSFWRKDLTGAREALQESRRIAEELVKQDPANTLWQRLLLGARLKLTLLDAPTGRKAADERLAILREMAAVTERLVRQDPDRLRWRLDLAGVQMQIGQSYLNLREQGLARETDLPEAVAALRGAVSAYGALRDLEPNNDRWPPSVRSTCGLALLLLGPPGHPPASPTVTLAEVREVLWFVGQLRPTTPEEKEVARQALMQARGRLEALASAPGVGAERASLQQQVEQRLQELGAGR